MLALDPFFEKNVHPLWEYLTRLPIPLVTEDSSIGLVRLHRIDEMIEQGASIIDIGGESTDHAPLLKNQRKSQVPILQNAVPRYSDQVIFSIDTTKYGVAEQALDAGALIINDVSGLQKSPAMAG